MTTPIAPATPITTGPTTAKVRPSGWWVALAIFLLLVGPGGCSAVLVSKSVSFINGYNRYASFRMPVEDGTFTMRQSSTDRAGIFLRSANESGGAAVDQIKVTSPSGHDVELSAPQDSINAPVPNGGYLSILRYFHVDESGTYHVRASGGTASRGAELGIGTYDVENLSAWLAGGFAVGTVVFLIGLVMLIIVLVRRSRSKRQVRMAGLPPGAPHWGPPGAAPPPPLPPGWGAAPGPPGPPSDAPPYGSPPSTPPPSMPPPTTPPPMPPQPQQPSAPPAWGAPTPEPPPPEQWAPAPWSAPTAPAPPPPPPPAAEPSTAPSTQTGVPAPPVSAPIPTVRPWQDAPARRKPDPEPTSEPDGDVEPGAPGGGEP